MTRFDQQSGPGGYEPSASGVSQRVQAIIESAEQYARDIRHEAEIEKRRLARDSEHRLAEVDDGLRRMSAVADALVERADELRRQVDEMISMLRRPEVEAPRAQAPPPRAEPAPRHEQRPPRPRFTQPPTAPRVEPSGDYGPERLVAIQMALAGRSREEVAERLTRGFALDDPDQILDEVFG